MEAVCSSDTSASAHKATRCQNLQDYDPHNQRRGKLRAYTNLFQLVSLPLYGDLQSGEVYPPAIWAAWCTERSCSGVSFPRILTVTEFIRVWICCLHLRSETKVELYLHSPIHLHGILPNSTAARLRIMSQDVAVNYYDIKFQYISWCTVDSSEKISSLCGFERMTTWVQSYVPQSMSVVRCCHMCGWGRAVIFTVQYQGNCTVTTEVTFVGNNYL
jgi:hypothetical protein